jgi:hypothetical protein
VAQLSRGRVSVPAQAALSGSPKKASGFAGGPYFTANYFRMWWPETGLNRRRRPFQGVNI